MNNEVKYGVFILRGQPVHKAHIWHIEQALKENDRLCLIIGSSNKSNTTRNPFDIKTRLNMIIGAIKDLDGFDRIDIHTLPDWSKENSKINTEVWGHYLYYNIVSRIGQKKFTMYYSDEPSIIESWFDDEVREFITLKLTDRQTMFDGLSSTKIRKAILDNSDESNEYLRRYLTDNVYNMIPLLREHLEYIENNPEDDFSML
jgi:nicotinamide mononucleotide adenylyltransferase